MISIKIMIKPRVNKNELGERAGRPTGWAYNQADKPAKNIKTGAQKCVAKRVKNKSGSMVL